MKALLTTEQLGQALLQVRGATPITFTAITSPGMNKTGKSGEDKVANPYLDAVKVARVNGMVNFHYDAGVLRRLAKKGLSAESFERGESWHEPVMNEGRLTPLCRHKTKGGFYLRFMHIQSIGEAEYRDEAGNLIEAEAIKPFLKKASTYANQGLDDDPLVFLVYALKSIREITYDEKTFIIAGE